MYAHVCVCVFVSERFSCYILYAKWDLSSNMSLYVCVYKLRGLTLPNSRLEV